MCRGSKIGRDELPPFYDPFEAAAHSETSKKTNFRFSGDTFCDVRTPPQVDPKRAKRKFYDP